MGIQLVLSYIIIITDRGRWWISYIFNYIPIRFYINFVSLYSTIYKNPFIQRLRASTEKEHLPM